MNFWKDFWKEKVPDIQALRDNKDVPALISALKHSDLHIQWRAAEALVTLGPEGMVPLIQALKRKNKDIRLGCIEVLGEIRDPRAVKPLLEILGDNSNEIRLQAALALGQIGDETAIGPLLTLLRDSDKYVRYGASLALQQLKWTTDDPSARAYIYLGTQEWEKLSALGESAIPALSTALQDRDAGVREKAVELLGSIQASAALYPVYRSLRDGDDRVRWKAVLAAPEVGISLHHIPRGLRRRPQKRKNPVAAGILNFFLPGIGYWYLGRWWGLLIFQVDVTLTIFIFTFLNDIVALLLFPVYIILAGHAVIMAKRMPELS
jgi:HEAT repeat protein